jgi:aminopeptidase
METHLQKKYAEVVIKAGINLYRGQNLIIVTAPQTHDFSLVLAETAYQNGAGYVDIDVSSSYLTKKRIMYSGNEYLNFIPEYIKTKINEMIAHDWAYIRIDNTSELGALEEVDANLLDIIYKSERQARRRLLEVASKHIITWCVIAAPDPNWAGKIAPTDPSRKEIPPLNEVLIPILRLDTENPVKAWEEHSRRLTKRALELDNLNLDRLIFKNSLTDLEIGLTNTSIWDGGTKETPDGRIYIPNIPTEEVFTTPDYRRTHGKVYATRPVKLMDIRVEDAWFEFENGKVVKYGAKTNQNVLENYLKTDEGSAFVGEVALVDSSSPIYQSKLVFNSILYDENASCHIALGNGYPTCLSDGHTKKTTDDLKNAGCNVSIVHTDFMIGSDDLQVLGIDKSGREYQIIKDGKYYSLK